MRQVTAWGRRCKPWSCWWLLSLMVTIPAEVIAVAAFTSTCFIQDLRRSVPIHPFGHLCTTCRVSLFRLIQVLTLAWDQRHQQFPEACPLLPFSLEWTHAVPSVPSRRHFLPSLLTPSRRLLQHRPPPPTHSIPKRRFLPLTSYCQRRTLSRFSTLRPSREDMSSLPRGSIASRLSS
jgi:hypothetical protein